MNKQIIIFSGLRNKSFPFPISLTVIIPQYSMWLIYFCLPFCSQYSFCVLLFYCTFQSHTFTLSIFLNNVSQADNTAVKVNSVEILYFFCLISNKEKHYKIFDIRTETVIFSKCQVCQVQKKNDLPSIRNFPYILCARHWLMRKEMISTRLYREADTPTGSCSMTQQ